MKGKSGKEGEGVFGQHHWLVCHITIPYGMVGLRRIGLNMFFFRGHRFGGSHVAGEMSTSKAASYVAPWWLHVVSAKGLKSGGHYGVLARRWTCFLKGRVICVWW